MSITKEEFQLWKEDKVTKSVFMGIQERINEAKDILSVSAGMDPHNDRLLVGIIRALTEVLEVGYEVPSDNVSDSSPSAD